MNTAKSRPQIVYVGTTAVVITNHVIERFAERIAQTPSDTLRAFMLLRQMLPAATIQVEPPAWSKGKNADAWIVIGPDCALPCKAVKRGTAIELVSCTLIVKDGNPAARRRRRPSKQRRGATTEPTPRLRRNGRGYSRRKKIALTTSDA